MRFVSIWFCHLQADWMVRRQPDLRNIPFVLASPEHGRMVVTAAGRAAQANSIFEGMVVADCRTILPALQVFDGIPGLAERLLNGLAEWCIRYTPVAAVDLPDGIILDASGCTHLWGGDQEYLKDIVTRLKTFGYDVRAAMADTIGAAWAIARFGKNTSILASGMQLEALLPLPPAALRLEQGIVVRMQKLGLQQVRSFIRMPRRALRRRFGETLLLRLDQALGTETETIQPVVPVQLYQERLPCLEPIRTATGIEIALQRLLETLCSRLEKEGKGIRTAVFKGYRIDGNIQKIDIGTNRATRNVKHLFKLFDIKIPQLEPRLGFELFLLETPIVEDITAEQEAIWNATGKQNDAAVMELLDTIAGKLGKDVIHRYMPAEHHWPERSFMLTETLDEKPVIAWPAASPRPVHLLHQPEPVEVTVPLPDYPPMLFIYKGVLHQVKKADGPERIEQEWWIDESLYRDYYCVEDENGARYWLFRLGDYSNCEPKWFIHGFFA